MTTAIDTTQLARCRDCGRRGWHTTCPGDAWTDEHGVIVRPGVFRHVTPPVEHVHPVAPAFMEIDKMVTAWAGGSIGNLMRYVSREDEDSSVEVEYVIEVGGTPLIECGFENVAELRSEAELIDLIRVLAELRDELQAVTLLAWESPKRLTALEDALAGVVAQ